MRYSIEPRDQMPKLYFAKNIGKKLGGKYCQKRLARAKKFTTDALQKELQKAAEATGDLIGNTKASETSAQITLNTAKREAENIKFDKEIPKERYIS